MVTKLKLLALASFLFAGLVYAQRPVRIDDFSKFQDVTDPHLSADGQWILYTVTTTDLAAEKRNSNIWVVKWDGSQTSRLTYTLDTESSPRWSPDGKYISFPLVAAGRQGQRQSGLGAEPLGG